MTFARSRVRAPTDAPWTLPRPETRNARGATCDAVATRDGGDPWQAYWETLPFRAELCRFEAGDFLARLAAVVALQRDWRVLDFGCGFGVVAALVAPSVREVCAWDPSPSMRAWAQRNAADILLSKIVKDGEIVRVNKGRYAPPSQNSDRSDSWKDQTVK
jgi:SAM-dependent methyltransferase